MRKVNPWLKATLEYGPLIVFFVAFLWLKSGSIHLGGVTYSGVVGATVVFVPVLVLATLALWALTGKLSVMQVVTLALVVVFGGLSIWLNDPRFFKMKPTIIYLLFAGLLGLGALMGRNWLQVAIGAAVPLQAQGWRILTWRLIVFFLLLAAANEVIWRATEPGGFAGLTLSDLAWVNFKTFGLPAATFLFFVLNSRLFTRYALPKDQD